MQLCFATNNVGKLQEIKHLLGKEFSIVGLADIGHNGELPENQATLEGNSMEKARFVYEKYGIDCFADDTGLEVEALNGEPGVYSARFAGPEKDSEANMQLLLEKLNGHSNRNAKFKTIITLILKGEAYQFEGEVAGKITEKRQGAKGFGYDPIFVPNGYSLTFAEMDMAEKNEVSHRARALGKLVKFLQDPGQ